MRENVYPLCFFERIVSITTKQKPYNKDFKLQAAELVARQGYLMAVVGCRPTRSPSGSRRFANMAS
jgi:hypothetical protein